MPITIEKTISTRVLGIDDPDARHKQGDGSGVRRHRVAIVGSGFGGLFAAKALRRADVEVTVIDRTNHHLFQPLLYQVAAGILSEGDIAPPIRDVLRKQRNTSVVLGEVVDVDIDARRLIVDTIGHRSEIAYDSLIIATGASQSYFGHPEFAEDAPGMKTIDDALELRGRIFGAFEMAEREPDPATRRQWLTFVVVGAGPRASKSPVRLPSCRAVRCTGIFVASIRLKRGSFYSTLVKRSSNPSPNRSERARRETSNRWESKSIWAQGSLASTKAESIPTRPIHNWRVSKRQRSSGLPGSRPPRLDASLPKRRALRSMEQVA